MIDRYRRPEMDAIWSDENRLSVYKDVEVAVVAGWVELGVAPPEALVAAENAPVPTPAQVAEREQVTNHDLAAFVDVLTWSAGPGGEWIHYGLTSSDVIDTAGGVLMARAGDLLITAVRDLAGTVRSMAETHRHTPMLGRTHGIWAEPTSFGLKLATWVFELDRDLDRLRAARREVAVGKISGAVGTYAHTPPALETIVCGRLGIEAEPASSQVTMRDRHAQFLSAIALTGASIERFATELRHLQRSEVGEVGEAFATGQKGSSAMPHKRNPITAERMTGLARVLRGYAQVGLENVALWHERDISHSSAERIVLPDACHVLYYMLVTFDRLMRGLVVDQGRMAANLDSTRGLVCSQAVLLALVDAGLTRDEAYRVVQRNAMEAWNGTTHLRDLLATDPDCILDEETLAGCFEMDRFLRNTGGVFERMAALDL